jgi:hypothetical protein
MNKKSQEPVVAKSCFGHLGGKLGNLLFKRMIELKWFKPKAGKTNTYGIRERYKITEKGYRELAKIGVDLSDLEEKAKR